MSVRCCLMCAWHKLCQSEIASQLVLVGGNWSRLVIALVLLSWVLVHRGSSYSNPDASNVLVLVLHSAVMRRVDCAATNNEKNKYRKKIPKQNNKTKSSYPRLLAEIKQLATYTDSTDTVLLTGSSESPQLPTFLQTQPLWSSSTQSVGSFSKYSFTSSSLIIASDGIPPLPTT